MLVNPDQIRRANTIYRQPNRIIPKKDQKDFPRPIEVHGGGQGMILNSAQMGADGNMGNII